MTLSNIMSGILLIPILAILLIVAFPIIALSYIFKLIPENNTEKRAAETYAYQKEC